jgi:HlyD family secretion protein
VKKAIDSALDALNQVFAALKSCYSVLENSLTSSSFTLTDLNTIKTNISTQQTAIATALSITQTAAQNLDNAILAYDTNVNSAENALSQAQAAYDNAVTVARNALSSAKVTGSQQITAAESRVAATLEAWRVAQAQLDKTIAPADKYDTALAQAKIKQAQAALDSVSSQIANCYIGAPIAGVITKVNYDIGEQVMAGQPVMAILGKSGFEIEVLISEADITKIKVNDPAEITLDAYGEDVKFSGRVYFIEPAETVIQDVIYYKVKINFDPVGRDIKSGMTANVIITTASRNDVLVMPGRAVVEKNGDGNLVRIFTADGQVRESPVTTGLRGDEGMVEVLSGVNEGDKVITYIKTN